MKKLIISFVFAVAAICVYAQTFKYEGINYNILSEADKTCEVANNPTASGDITIPETVPYDNSQYTVTSIGYDAFYFCTSLTSVTLPENLNSIGVYAFSYCTGLTSVILPENLTSIGDNAFSSCNGLTSITFPESLTSIGERAFSSCTSLTLITIPEKVTSIGEAAFSNCTNLTEINVASENKNYTSIDGVLFSKDLKSLLNYPGGKLGDYTVPDGVVSIKNYAFYSCTGLTSITFPESLTSIGSYAFYLCTSLTSVNLPESLTSIGFFAFYSCTGLTSITLPASLTSIGDHTFSTCTDLTEINVASENKNYASIDGVLFSKDLKTLVTYPGGKLGEYTVPDGVVSIGAGAFTSCTGLTSVILPESLTSIGNNAFLNCTGLTSITLPASLTSIGDHTFSSCTSVITINSYATTPPVCNGGEGVFHEIPSDAVLHVPVGTKEAYASANGWSQFSNIIDDLEVDEEEDADTCVSMSVSDNKVEIAVNEETELIVSLKGLKVGTSTLTLTLTDESGEETTETVIISVVKEATDVEALFVEDEESMVDIYHLNGILLRKNVRPEAVLELPKGIYIVGNKKVLVK